MRCSALIKDLKSAISSGSFRSALFAATPKSAEKITSPTTLLVCIAVIILLGMRPTKILTIFDCSRITADCVTSTSPWPSPKILASSIPTMAASPVVKSSQKIPRVAILERYFSAAKSSTTFRIDTKTRGMTSIRMSEIKLRPKSPYQSAVSLRAVVEFSGIPSSS